MIDEKAIIIIPNTAHILEYNLAVSNEIKLGQTYKNFKLISCFSFFLFQSNKHKSSSWVLIFTLERNKVKPIKNIASDILNEVIK